MASERLRCRQAVWSWGTFITHMSTTCTKFNGPVVNSRGWISYASTSKMKVYFSKKIIFQPAIQYTPYTIYTEPLFISFSFSKIPLCPCAVREMVSCLISEVSQWLWTPCWHIHSTWAIADSFEYNLHNYTSSSPVKHMPQTPCCSQHNSMNRNSHINACGKKTLNIEAASSICIVWDMMVLLHYRYDPPPHPQATTITKHTHAHTQNTSSSPNIPTKTGNLAACERWPKFLRCFALTVRF